MANGLGLGLAAGYGAGGAVDALQELIAQQHLEKQLALRQQQEARAAEIQQRQLMADQARGAREAERFRLELEDRTQRQRRDEEARTAIDALVNDPSLPAEVRALANMERYGIRPPTVDTHTLEGPRG